MSEEIFYPNELTLEEIESLDGWKLKVAIMHFGKQRGDCQRFGYGYVYRQEKPGDIGFNYLSQDDLEHIILVADRDGEQHPISLKKEIDWDNPSDLLAETGLSLNRYLKDYLKNKISKNKNG